jgi:Ca2+-transporting ATPase
MEHTKPEIDLHKDWHTIPSEEVLQIVNSSPTGLTEAESALRLEKYGTNELTMEKRESPFILLFNQFKSLLIIILIIAAGVSFWTDGIAEGISILIIVILAGVLGFFQEFQADKAIESLQKMASPHAQAVRGGNELHVEAAKLVPGDIIILKTGDKIPADGRLIEASNLQIEESSLTGESLAVEKASSPIDGKNIPLGDRKNMVYSGTTISYGRGKAVVVATGMNTEFGKIAGMLQSTKNRRTPLQENLDQLGKKLGIFSIALAAAMSGIGLLRGYPFEKMFIWGVALAVAVIPEALPAVVTISLALGVQRMVKRKALIRKLPAVETLGATNIICSDKTGTLTHDEMTIKKIYVSGRMYDVEGAGYTPEGNYLIGQDQVEPKSDKDLHNLLKFGTLCNDTILQGTGNSWSILGDPTEGAIVVAAVKAGIEYSILRDEFPRLDEIPFSSESKRMTTLHKVKGRLEAYSKGAIEVIIKSCTSQYTNGEIVELTEDDRKNILGIATSLSEGALRVLAVSAKVLTAKVFNQSELESGMVFVGMVGMYDPPRAEAKAAIDICFSAGIKPIMITGDNKVTAKAIAKSLGILRKGRALSGVELDELSDEEFEHIVEETEVFARISPSHKLKIVTALMDNGHIVAMTGDGVNDAPSLKKADIGIAMGITGTDVSKEAADMILTDDNFASIVNAVEEGRSIFENIRKYLVFLLSGNMGTVFALIYTLLAGLIIPLTAVQILFINFIMDGLIAIALGVEPPEPGIMKRKPRNVKEGILNKDTIVLIGFIGILIAIVTTGVYVWAGSSGFTHDQAKTMFFLTLIFARLFNGFNCRSLEQSIFTMKFFSNKVLIFSSLVSLIMSILVVYVPFLQQAFTTTLPSLVEWLGMVVAAFLIIVVVETVKWLFRRMAS